jgi:hypothetical protein
MARERGEGKFGLIVFLAVIAIVVFVAFKYVPPRVNAYEFKEFVEQTAVQAPYDPRSSPENLKIKLVEKAHDLKIPLEAEEISIQKTGEICTIGVVIKIPIDFAVTKYTLVLDCSTNSKAAT